MGFVRSETTNKQYTKKNSGFITPFGYNKKNNYIRMVLS